MKPAPEIADEDARCQALVDLSILDTPSEERFDRITRLVRKHFGVKIALVSLVDRDRQWFKSRQGLDAMQTDRSISFCGHAIERNEVFVVEDTHADDRFCDNPLVTDAPHIRFYAGCPLHSEGGHLLGTLCIIDDAPRRFDREDRSALLDFGLLAGKELRQRQRRQPAWVGFFARLVRSSGAPQSAWWGRLLRSWRPAAERLSERQFAALSGFVIACLLGWAALAWDQQQLRNSEAQARQEALQTLGLMRGELETALNARLHLVHGLSGLVHADRVIREEAFQAFAQQLGTGVSQIRSLQLAPGGVVKHVWPLEQNRKAIGHDLLADASRREAAMRAIEARQIWLAGPINLLQGGQALIGRLPIFMSENVGDVDEVWWGFATILIDVPELLTEVGLLPGIARFDFALRGRDALGRSGEVFFGDRALFDGEPLRAEVALPAGVWELAILPRGGWPHYWAGQTSFRLGTLLVMLLVGGLVYFLLRLPHNTRRAIRLATAQLASTQARFRDAIEALPTGFTVFDADDRLAVCNERIREIYPLSRPRLEVGRHFREILEYGLRQGEVAGVEPTDAAQVEQALSLSVARHQQPAEAFDIELSDGRWVRVVEQRTQDGGSVSFHIDVTAQKHSEQSLEEARLRAEAANQAKSTFLATVSHEVRTPLNGVLGMLSVLAADQNMTDKQREYLQTAHNSAKHLLTLLNEILDISKMEAGKLELEDEDFSLADTLNEAVELLQAQAREKGLVLETQFDPQLAAHVRGDAARLRQVLLNLISNAIKFTDEGQVRVEARQLDGKADSLRFAVEITDSGIGFSPEEAQQLFEPFTQLDSDADRRFKGTGLGLAICKSLIDQMGGEISATGQRGQGATFRIALEFARVTKAADTVQPEVERPLTPVELGWPRVSLLLAEDSPTNQLVIQAMLNGTGYAVDAVGNGKEAVTSARQFDYDLVLMDVYMPEMDGLQATRIIRETIPVEKMPIIALTANAMAGDRERYVEAGMDDYLPKPLNRAALLAALHRWLAPRMAARMAAQEPS